MTQNFGFLPSPYANINLIRDNLNDRYRDGFPVVKELVQNADDAGATQLDIAWTRGLPEAEHPLLQGPAIVVINDGPFDDRNNRAIRQLGLSDRANQQATIGKFGLGLKSIFHLCEAFFYLASDAPASAGHEPRYDRIFNPWSGGYDTDIHQDWNQFSVEDRTRLLTHLRQFLDMPRWFCMWIPLRRQAHLGGYDAIKGDYPGDRDGAPTTIFSSDVGTQLANILPMLHSLQAIRGWQWQDDRQVFGRLFAASLDEGSSRRHDPSAQSPGRWQWGGRLVVETAADDGSTKTMRAVYVGEEELLDAPSFRALRQETQWPRYTVTDDMGRPLVAPEKAQPHGVVYFTALPAQGGGALMRFNALFLPVGDPQPSGARALLGRGITGEVVMLNLLRFRAIADYSETPDLAPDTPISGAEAFAHYVTHTLPLLRDSGGDLLFLGEGGGWLIGPQEERWDVVMLVRQRSVETFLAFGSNEAIRAGLGHRTAAVEDSRLLPLMPARLPL